MSAASCDWSIISSPAMIAEASVQPEIAIERFEIFAAGPDHPECVAFDATGFLWAGGEAGQVYRIDSAGRVETTANLGGFCAGLAFSPDGALFVCNPLHGIVKLPNEKPASGSGTSAISHEIFASHAGDHKLISPNYGVFDSRRNYYVTDSGKWKQPNGYLLRFSPDGNGSIIAGPFRYPNGLALSADDKTLYMVESETNSVHRLSLNHDGGVTDDHVYAVDCGRFPDGLALDADGNLYVSCYASDDIHRISPSGEKTLFAHDPWGILLGRPTNLAFGNDGFMYVANFGRTTITRAQTGIKGQPLANQRSR